VHIDWFLSPQFYTPFDVRLEGSELINFGSAGTAYYGLQSGTDIDIGDGMSQIMARLPEWSVSPFSGFPDSFYGGETAPYSAHTADGKLLVTAMFNAAIRTPQTDIQDIIWGTAGTCKGSQLRGLLTSCQMPTTPLDTRAVDDGVK
jgi:hypothetical protein